MSGDDETAFLVYEAHPLSEWRLVLFDGPSRIIYHIAKGVVPNAFQRWVWTRVLGVRWEHVPNPSREPACPVR